MSEEVPIYTMGDLSKFSGLSEGVLRSVLSFNGMMPETVLGRGVLRFDDRHRELAVQAGFLINFFAEKPREAVASINAASGLDTGSTELLRILTSVSEGDESQWLNLQNGLAKLSGFTEQETRLFHLLMKADEDRATFTDGMSVTKYFSQQETISVKKVNDLVEEIHRKIGLTVLSLLIWNFASK
jgi:hypothetical protein